MKTEDETLVDSVSDEIHSRLGKGSIHSLPWVSQVVVVIVGTQGIIDNGGFVYFFEQDWTDNPPYSVFADAFRAIGADECAECIEVAASLFPCPNPHLHSDARRDYLREHCMVDGRTDSSAVLVKLGDRVIDHSDANLALLARYIHEHLREIRNT